MEKRDLKISIAHLYPKLLNLYGDSGNIIALKKRCEWRGITVDFTEVNIGSDIPIADLYFIGGGQDKQLGDVATEIFKYKEFLIEQRNSGAVFLGICGGYQLFGNYYLQNDGEKVHGLSLLDAHTVAAKKRFIGNVTAKIQGLLPDTLVGFENHSGLTYLEGETKPLATLSIGKGNNGDDGFEGARYMNVFGTYLHGSLLPKNPHFADCLIELALERRYGEKIKLEQLNDDMELKTHISLIGKAY